MKNALELIAKYRTNSPVIINRAGAFFLLLTAKTFEIKESLKAEGFSFERIPRDETTLLGQISNLFDGGIPVWKIEVEVEFSATPNDLNLGRNTEKNGAVDCVGFGRLTHDYNLKFGFEAIVSVAPDVYVLRHVYPAELQEKIAAHIENNRCYCSNFVNVAEGFKA